MAEQLCELKKKGGANIESLLWTNPNPRTNFTQQDITLLEDINNYKYIKVVFKSSTTVADKHVGIGEVSDIGTGATNGNAEMYFGWRNTSGTHVARFLYKTSTGNVIHISGGYQLSSTSTANSNVIPYKIFGIK